MGIKQQLILFMYDNKLTQRQIAKTLQISHEHLCRVLGGKYEISDRLRNKIEQLFQKYYF